MLKCRDVTRLASDWIDGELATPDRIRVRLHLLMCRHCRQFMKGLETTRELIRMQDEPDKLLQPELLSRLDRAIVERLGQQEGPSAPVSFSADTVREAVNEPFMAGVTEPEDKEVQAIFAEITEKVGFVPNLYRVYAHNPDVLAQNWSRVKSLMFEGRLSPELKNVIATVVSFDNGCDYCVQHHTATLSMLGVTPEEVEGLLQDRCPERFTARDRALLALTRVSNRNPHGTPLEAVEDARAHGATEAEIIEALGVMELYASFNKFLDTMKIPLEEVIGG